MVHDHGREAGRGVEQRAIDDQDVHLSKPCGLVMCIEADMRRRLMQRAYDAR